MPDDGRKRETARLLSEGTTARLILHPLKDIRSALHDGGERGDAHIAPSKDVWRPMLYPLKNIHGAEVGGK
jgi:hypothetical protein